MPSYFVNLLPEGSVLRSLARRAKVAESDLVGLLSTLGEDAVGDVTLGGGGLLGLSPIYDRLCTLVYGDQTLALSLDGQDEEITRKDLVALAMALAMALAEAFEIRREPVLRRLGAMLALARPWLERIGEVGFDASLTERLRSILVERHAALLG